MLVHKELLCLVCVKKCFSGVFYINLNFTKADFGKYLYLNNYRKKCFLKAAGELLSCFFFLINDPAVLRLHGDLP